MTFSVCILLLAVGCAVVLNAQPATIVCPPDAAPQVKLAAKEVRRYVFLRSDELLPIATGADGPSIRFAEDKELGEQAYRLSGDGKNLTITGGSPVAVLYGAYAFAEKLGVRFELDGDVLPDAKVRFALPTLNETRQPDFALRGIQPFHDFYEGPDWWNADDYKAYLTQLAKMKMNFIGLHSYPWFKPWSHVPPEPGVWVGMPEDVTADGHVTSAYPASWANTARPGPGTDNAWGHKPGRTSDFCAGASQLFTRDDYGSDVMAGMTPWPQTKESQVELFNRAGDMFKDAFGHAHGLGIQVCVGVETPFWIPDEVRAKLVAQGRNPDSPDVRKELCRGMFQRIMRSHPVDRFWLWTPERPLDPAATLADMRLIQETAKELNIKTAICGWGWLAHQFSAFDGALPKDIAFSCINDRLGFTPVTGEFAKINGRDRWCIPWMEDDTNMTAPQLFAGRVRKDAADAKRMGCNGLMGIHWRTRVISPSLDMLAQCGWSAPKADSDLIDIAGSLGTAKLFPVNKRALPTNDFYAGWCSAQFGEQAGPKAAMIFASNDSRLPRPSCWAGKSVGPGNVGPSDPRPWQTVAKEYTFVDEFAALRSLVTGNGAAARFDYWLGQFHYLRAMGKVRCVRAELEQALAAAEKAPSEVDNAKVLEARIQLVTAWQQMLTFLLETVSTPGEMGTVANLEIHSRMSSSYLTEYDARLAKLLGRPLPAECSPAQTYAGKARLIVPTVRSVATAGEALSLNILALDKAAAKSVAVKWRKLGSKDWQTTPATHHAGANWRVQFPAAAHDFEYHIEALTADGQTLRWPASAPAINQTVVVE